MGFNALGAAVTVSSTATKLCDAAQGRESLVFTHVSGSEVYYGDSAVSTTRWVFKTAAADAPVTINTQRVGEVAAMSSWYGITSSSTASVNVGQIQQ